MVVDAHTVYVLNFLHGLIFHVFDWQENFWVINFCGHGSVVVQLLLNLLSMLVIVD